MVQGFNLYINKEDIIVKVKSTAASFFTVYLSFDAEMPFGFLTI